jgi:hypothetical protein
MVTEAKFDPVGKARARGRLLELIPEPTGQAYDDAARAALIRAGVSAENIAILEEADRQPPSVFRPNKPNSS